MSLPVRFHRLAEADVVEAWLWYETRRPGLGDQFLASVEATINRASRWPNAGAQVGGGGQGEVTERKVATHGFPYAVRYRVSDGQLVVMAVYHQHRDPGFRGRPAPLRRPESTTTGLSVYVLLGDT